MTDDPENRENRERPVDPLARRAEDSLSADGVRRMCGEHDPEALRRLAEEHDLVALGQSIREQEERSLAQWRRWIEQENRNGRFDPPYWIEEGGEQ